MIYFLQTHVVEKEFYEKLDFYIFLVLSVFGLIFSVLSWKQAQGAKRAAENAGKIVKIQDILLDIPEIVNLCQQLDYNAKYKEANPQWIIIMGKISLIIGLIKEYSDRSPYQQTLIDEIEKTLTSIRDILKSLNPYYMESSSIEIKDTEGRIYNAIAPYLTILVPQLNSLTGSLHGGMIQNK